MSYGLSIFNTNGSLIISETYSNYQVIASGISASNVAPSGFTTSPEQITAVAVRPNVSSFSGQKLYVPNTSTTTRIHSTTGYYEWVVLTYNANVTSEHGLRVKREDGSIAFDSGIRNMSPVVQATIPEASVFSGANVTFSTGIPVPVGKKRYAISYCVRPLGFYYEGVEPTRLLVSSLTFNSDTVFTSSSNTCYIAGPPIDYSINWVGTHNILIVDI